MDRQQGRRRSSRTATVAAAAAAARSTTAAVASAETRVSVTPSPSSTVPSSSGRSRSRSSNNNSSSSSDSNSRKTKTSKFFRRDTTDSGSVSTDDDDDQDHEDYVGEEGSESEEEAVHMDSDDEPIINLKRKRPPIPHSSPRPKSKKAKTKPNAKAKKTMMEVEEEAEYEPEGSDSEEDEQGSSSAAPRKSSKPARSNQTKTSAALSKSSKTTKGSAVKASKENPLQQAAAAAAAAAVSSSSAKKLNNKKAATAGKKKKTKEDDEERDDPNDRPLIMASDTDSDDEKDAPYRVEYAATGRATCKSCDQRIQKGEVRIASRPLFQGKPGFVVFRHLQCQLLPPDEVPAMSSVGGWRRLKESDRKRLEAQVHESVRLVEQENEELDADELVQAEFTGETRPSPPGLAATLLPFQVEGVSWMYCQEIGDVKGGILADEMGMGKTLQTITTILDNRPLLQHTKPGIKHPPSSPDLEKRKAEEILWKKSNDECYHTLKMANVPDVILTNAGAFADSKTKKNKKKRSTSSFPGTKYEIGARAGTLVICPVIALSQWKSEIEKFTEDKALSVCVYHGTDRRTKFPQELLCKYDVILTTYQVIEADFRKMVSPNKVRCPNCGQSYKIEKLAVHLKYFCGETAQRTEAQMRQRRTADRRQDGNNDRRGGGSGSTSKKTPSKGKKSFKQVKTKNKAAATKKNSSRKTIRAPATKDYDSDSSLSVAEDMDRTPSKRPSRAAATSATKKMSASKKMWANDFYNDEDSDSEEFADIESDDGDDDDEIDSEVEQKSRESRSKKNATKSTFTSDSETDSEEDDAAMARVRKRQKAALEMATKSKKALVKYSPSKKSQKGRSKKTSQSKKGKKKPEDSSSEDDSDDESGDRNDPLDGVDMEALKAEAMEGCEVSVLHTMCFFRVVLDEAHNIKSRSSQTTAAAFHLTSIHRWCLSGTPLQNRVGELYSLLRFLQIDNWAHYFCRKEGCDCKSIFYRMKNGVCQDCNHGSTQHYSYFNRKVLNVIQREGYSGDGRRAMMKLKSEVLDKSLLRRTKDGRAEDMNLPPRVVTIKSIRLHPREQDFYDGLYTSTKTSFSDYVEQGVVLNNFAHLFDLLTKLRQSVDHPYLLVYSKKNASTASAGQLPINVSSVCELCEETPTERVVASCCDAAFCRTCVVDMMNSLDGTEVTRCPRCENPFSIDLNQESAPSVEDDGVLKVGSNRNSITTGDMPSLKDMSHVASGSILRRIPLTEFATSTKIEALVQELVQMRQERQGSKALVFSQFVNMLDLVRWRLHSDPCLNDLGLGVRIIHGGMNVQSRDEALKAFREDPSVRVLLMSLKAGGVALNLTVANEAYLLDPWWNPAAEMQAIDRTHRLGQYRPIRAVRFICEGTVEERVLQLQEKKRLVFDGTVGRDAASLKMLTVEDMKGLFA